MRNQPPDARTRIPEIDVATLVPIGCRPDRMRVFVGVDQQCTHCEFFRFSRMRMTILPT